jgi:hypothetical protein
MIYKKKRSILLIALTLTLISCNQENQKSDSLIGIWQGNENCILIVKAGEYYEITSSLCDLLESGQHVYVPKFTKTEIYAFNKGCFEEIPSKKPIICQNTDSTLVYQGISYKRK